MADENAKGPTFEERLMRLEKTTEGLLERQLRTITVIFGFVSAVVIAPGIIVSGLAIYGKIEVRDATREMERKFEMLAGQALKAPILRILYEGGELNQKVISVKAEGKTLHLSAMQLQNTGNRATEFISVRLQFAANVQAVAQLWESTLGSDKDFPSASFTGGPIRISPQETWNLAPVTVVTSGIWPPEVRAKVHAFYGQERPAEAVFLIRISQ